MRTLKDKYFTVFVLFIILFSADVIVNTYDIFANNKSVKMALGDAFSGFLAVTIVCVLFFIMTRRRIGRGGNRETGEDEYSELDRKGRD